MRLYKFICDCKKLFAIHRFYLPFEKFICDLQILFAIPKIHLRSSDFICDSKNLFAFLRFYLRFQKFICDLQILFAIPKIYLRSSDFICDSKNLFANHPTYLRFQAIASPNSLFKYTKKPRVTCTRGFFCPSAIACYRCLKFTFFNGKRQVFPNNLLKKPFWNNFLSLKTCFQLLF